VARAQIWESIYQALLADAPLLELLGPVTLNNLRILRSFPQLQSLLTDYEPQNEGWLVIDEPKPSLRAISDQITSAWEVIEPVMSIFATRFSLCDDASDRIDQSFHWSIVQQRDLQFGERIVLFTRRIETADKYDSEVKLYRKDVTYKIEMVVEEQLA
jgi:hypothetical protein